MFGCLDFWIFGFLVQLVGPQGAPQGRGVRSSVDVAKDDHEISERPVSGANLETLNQLNPRLGITAVACKGGEFTLYNTMSTTPYVNVSSSLRAQKMIDTVYFGGQAFGLC